MINFIWGAMILGGIIYAAWHGRIDAVTMGALKAAEDAVSLCLRLVGAMCLWLGVMKIAERAGAVTGLARLLGPVVRRLFPSVPAGHPAIGAIVMTVSANMLGMGNAATPLGIKAMQELQTLNRDKTRASDAMCTMLGLCTAGFTVVPSTIIALRAATGAKDPSGVVASTLLVSLAATAGVLIVDAICRALAELCRTRR